VPNTPDPRPFQVDLKGVVDLLGRHIYSSPRVYLRELLQNGVDAITARRLGESTAGTAPTVIPAEAGTPGARREDSTTDRTDDIPTVIPAEAGTPGAPSEDPATACTDDIPTVIPADAGTPGARPLDGGAVTPADRTPDSWGIRIYPATPDWPEFVLVDDGVGLTADEVTDLLATVGRSSKRDILDMARTDYLGQFGIGLLSCFMVCDEIRILSQSAVPGSTPVEWIGSGDGTFQVRPYAGVLPIGTQVHLGRSADNPELLTDPAVTQLATQYGQFLPVPIDIVRRAGRPSGAESGGRVLTSGAGGPAVPAGRIRRDDGGERRDDEQLPGGFDTAAAPLAQPPGSGTPLTEPPGTTFSRINQHPGFLDDDPDFPTLMSYAREELGFEPLDVITLRAPGTGTAGIGYVLPFAPPPNARQSTRMYLGRMLLGARVDDLLPDWAFFVRAVLNSDGLTPTASREGLVEDYNLEYTRTQLGACVRSWLMDMALHQPHRFGAFLAVHEQAIKQLVLHDEEMAQIFTGWLTVETTSGRMSVDKLVKTSPTVRYARTLDEYRQIASLAHGDAPLVNGGYVYDTDLMELLPTVYPSVTVTRVDVLAELDRLDPPSLDDRALTQPLEDRATAALASRECQAVVRLMANPDTPALFVADPEVFRHIDRGRASQAAPGGLWAEILAQTDAFALSRSPYAESGFSTRLCLNWTNTLIRALATLTDRAVFDRCVQLLYVQSQLAGSYPLTSADRALMTTALADLIALTTLPPAADLA